MPTALDFLESLKNTVSTGAFHQRMPEYRKIELRPDGTQNLAMSLSSSMRELYGIKEDPISTIVLAFMLIDGYVDISFPALEGESFRYRYNNLPAVTSRDQVFRELYRLLVILRNATVHSRKCLNIEATSVKADYTNSKSAKKTPFLLEITTAGFDLLLSAVLYACNSSQPHPRIEAILLSFYDDIVKEIRSVQDLNGTILPTITGRKLNRSLRYIVMNPTWSVKQGIVSVTKLIQKSPVLAGQGTDYAIQLQGTDLLVPEEVLDCNSLISERDALQWTNI